MRPSLEQVTSKPCLAPSSVTTVSQMLSLPSWRFTTACSKPEDLVNTRTDFFGAEKDRHERAEPAAVAANAAVVKVRRNSRRSEFVIYAPCCKLPLFVQPHHTTELAVRQRTLPLILTGRPATPGVGFDQRTAE